VGGYAKRKPVDKNKKVLTASGAVSRADEIGATAAEPATQMDDRDGLGHVFPFPIPDPQCESASNFDPSPFMVQVFGTVSEFAVLRGI
jgi:hypothetical protein